jgi:hypothetical protein
VATVVTSPAGIGRWRQAHYLMRLVPPFLTRSATVTLTALPPRVISMSTSPVTSYSPGATRLTLTKVLWRTL